jgi:hypothetical protein
MLVDHIDISASGALWSTFVIGFLVWLWTSTFRKARRMHNFDRSVGRFAVYAWHVAIALFWTVLIVLISATLFAVHHAEQ